MRWGRRRGRGYSAVAVPEITDLTVSCEAYYALDGDGLDATVNNHDATLAGATYTTGILGSAMNSATSEDVAATLTLGACSISAWVFFDATSAAHTATAGFRGSSVTRFQLAVNRTSTNATLSVAGGAATAWKTGITTAAWHHYAVTTKGDGVTRCYFDGAHTATLSGTPVSGLAVDVLRIAANVRAILDEASFYIRELSPANVAALYNGGVGDNPFV